MKTTNLRVAMPHTYAFIESCRDAFGTAAVNPQIKIGIEGADTFHAVENGHEVGTPGTSFDDLVGISPDDMVIKPNPKA